MKKTVASLAILFGFLPTSVFATSSFTLTNIGNLGGISEAFGLNDQGQVVGSTGTSDGNDHAFIWQNGSGMVDIGVVPGDVSSGALSINDAGQVVGISQALGGQPPHGFMWQASRGMVDMGAVTGLYTQTTQINLRGIAIGSASSSPYFGSNVFPFTYTTATGIQPVVVPGVPVSDIYALNGSGQMAVRSPISEDVLFITPGGAPVAIQGTGNLVGGAALAMNEGGTVIGFMNPSDGQTQHGYVWNQATGFIDLGVGFAQGLNDLDEVVGVRTLDDGSTEAYLYGNGVFYDLSTLLDASGANWENLNPRAINDRGQIAGFGTFDGQTEAFLLTPTGDGFFGTSGVPEPGSLSLLALSALPLFFRRRFRRAKS